VLSDVANITLRDGRRLAYATAGEAAGSPVVAIHGTPGCRDPETWEDAAAATGARLILPDRPGYGHSDLQPDQRLLDWPCDVEELADALQLDRFAVVGVSGGGPYAAACGYALPDRVTALGLVCAVGPFWDVPEVDATATGEAGSWIRELVDLARVDPDAAVAHAREECARDADMCERDPEEFVAYWFDGEGVPAPDRTALRPPELRERAKRQLREALRGGFEGYAQDELIIATRPWEFRVDEIRVPVHLWHGELDRLVPVESARYVARTIPRCSARFLPDEGHMLTVRHAEEILGTLVAASRDKLDR
jgi:pimeloyl-ACP methyl ester carboxylesterase